MASHQPPHRASSRARIRAVAARLDPVGWIPAVVLVLAFVAVVALLLLNVHTDGAAGSP